MEVANPTSPVQEPLFHAPDTFMRLPRWHVDAGSKAAIVGLPFDCGTHATRIGSRLGPRSIRERSQLLRPFHPVISDFNAAERLGAADCGDVRLTPGKVVDAYARIERSLAIVLDAGAIPFGLGGDGAVTLPQLRAVHRHHSDLVALHIDSHTDAYPSYPGVSFGDASDLFNTATTFVRAAEEELIDVRSSIHVGIRGFAGTSGNTEFTRELGYRVVESDEMFDIGFRKLGLQLREQLAGRPVYLCFDMDFFDPSCAPGVASPTWGGPSARQGLALLQALAGINFVAFDVNTVSPPHDVQGMAAHLASVVVLECMFLACYARGLVPGATSPT
jgi:agmatinase